MSDFHVQPGLYKHYKGNIYEVLFLARHSETLELLVVYKALYGGGEIWVRPANMFAEDVTLDGSTMPRFDRITDNSNM